jgi:hypothetical protein
MKEKKVVKKIKEINIQDQGLENTKEDLILENVINQETNKKKDMNHLKKINKKNKIVDLIPLQKILKKIKIFSKL